MDIFEKTAKTVKNASESVISSAKNIGISLYSSTKEQGELAGLNVQKSTIEKKLTDYYTEIGRRYVEYIANCNSGTAFFNVADILESMQPELDQLAQIKEQIQEKEIQIKQAAEEKAQKKAQEEFDAEKEKLDRALQLDILSEEEYEAKLETATRKLNNHDTLRKIRMQYEMGIISKEEQDEKIRAILQD